MILYLYALADRVERLDGLAGVEGEPLLEIDAGSARLIAGWVASQPAIERATLEAQDRIIRALHDRAAALLPMRFGTAAEGIDAAVRSVSIAARTLPERFDLVRGREQMTVRVLRTRSAMGDWGASGAWRAGPLRASHVVESEGEGTAYLRSRAEIALPEVQPLLDAVQRLARATRVERGVREPLLATIYQLIDRGNSAEYLALVQQAASSHADLTLRVSGPAPAYAFARE